MKFELNRAIQQNQPPNWVAEEFTPSAPIIPNVRTWYMIRMPGAKSRGFSLAYYM